MSETTDGPALLHDLTVVIPTLGRDILKRCLEALARGVGRPAEVVVVDQGRRREVASWAASFSARGLPVRHVPSGGRGRAAGVNFGIERASTQFVAVTDDDCLADPTWAVSLVRRLRARPDAIVTGRVEPAGDIPNPAVSTSRIPDEQRRPRLTFDRLSGGNMGVAVEVYRAVGPLDEHPTVRTAEDGEWAYRALRAGTRIVYAPEAVVHHFAWRETAAREAQYRSYARSHGGFYGKHLRRGDFFIALRAALHMLRAVRRWALGRLRGDAEAALIGRAYALGLLPGISAGFRRGREAERAVPVEGRP